MLKKRKLILAMSLSLVMGISSTVFALPSSNQMSPSTQAKKVEQMNHKRGCRKDGFNKLINQLGLTEQDITNGVKDGKTLFDLAKAKGFTPDQVRAMMLKNKTDAINQAVTKGEISREQGDAAIKKTKEMISKWDGSLKFKSNNYQAFKLEKLASIKELGLTYDELLNASKSGKTLFDLAKEKKGLTPDQVKSIIIKSKTDSINKKVEEGKITKDEAALIISKMTSKIQKWDGSLKPREKPMKQ